MDGNSPSVLSKSLLCCLNGSFQTTGEGLGWEVGRSPFPFPSQRSSRRPLSRNVWLKDEGLRRMWSPRNLALGGLLRGRHGFLGHLVEYPGANECGVQRTGLDWVYGPILISVSLNLWVCGMGAVGLGWRPWGAGR